MIHKTVGLQRVVVVEVEHLLHRLVEEEEEKVVEAFRLHQQVVEEEGFQEEEEVAVEGFQEEEEHCESRLQQNVEPEQQSFSLQPPQLLAQLQTVEHVGFDYSWFIWTVNDECNSIPEGQMIV